ncbi:MAG: hypothetical protein GF344_00970 [Chitinivibrionales bacterium]|nr:hypothetical protein [Chitinivibrionales bacterium]MBD3355677.1 hypothetical protein [Chitinivibrionales bacterium]
MIFRAFLLLFVMASLSFPQTKLSGDIGGMTIDSSGNPYIITENVTIPAEKSTHIGAGCVLLFEAFTGMIVTGTLRAAGTMNHPVVFTSVNDQRYNPSSQKEAEPFDWNGVYITPESEEVSLSNIVLAFSVYGIKSEKSALTLNNATFNANGQFHFTVNDSMPRVTEGVPFDYGKVEEPEEPKTLEVAQKSRSYRRSLLLPIALGATGCAAGAAGAIFFVKSTDAADNYDASTNHVRQKEFLEEYERSRGIAVACAAVAAAALPASVLLYVRAMKSEKNTVAIRLSPGLDAQFQPLIRMGVVVDIGKGAFR